MTEDEAKTKLCPVVRVTLIDQGEQTWAAPRCAASLCMT